MANAKREDSKPNAKAVKKQHQLIMESIKTDTNVSDALKKDISSLEEQRKDLEDQVGGRNGTLASLEDEI